MEPCKLRYQKTCRCCILTSIGEISSEDMHKVFKLLLVSFVGCLKIINMVLLSQVCLRIISHSCLMPSLALASEYFFMNETSITKTSIVHFLLCEM